MAIDNFKKSLSFVLLDEGGNDDDPADHGGRTSRGITQREYTAWLSEQGLQDKDVWTSTDQDIEEIYRTEYWNPYCDNFPSGIDYMYFDMAVNAGPHRAAVLLQRTLGINEDGRVGPVTREAITESDPDALIEKYTEVKRSFYLSLHQPKFTKGWLNRCDNVMKNALTMI